MGYLAFDEPRSLNRKLPVGRGNCVVLSPMQRRTVSQIRRGAEYRAEDCGVLKGGGRLDEAAEADRAKRVGDQFSAMFPGVVQYTTDVLFRDLWLRPHLAPRDRSLVMISALIAHGQVAQLTGHITIGMNNGLTQPEIAEAITHLAFYVGWPNVFSAMPVAKEVFEQRAR